MAPPLPLLHCAGCGGVGQVTVGAVVSTTVTMKEQPLTEVLPLASVAVQVTVVVPLGNVEPDAGVQVAVAPGQLSVAVAAL